MINNYFITIFIITIIYIMENYTSNWIKHPENIMINNLSHDNNEFYDTSNILTSFHLDIEFQYYKKYPLDIYINNKEQSRLLQEQILQNDIISKDDYELLSSSNKKIYVINEQQKWQDGYNSVYTQIISYIKKNIKENNLILLQEQSRLLQEQILQNDIISKDDYEVLSSSNKQLYVINEQQCYQDGYDSVYTQIISYIKMIAKEERDRKIKEENRIKEIKEIKTILSKITIYHHEYIKLNSEQKKLYYGDKTTQTEMTRYREGPNYFDLYHKIK